MSLEWYIVLSLFKIYPKKNIKYYRTFGLVTVLDFLSLTCIFENIVLKSYNMKHNPRLVLIPIISMKRTIN